MSLIVKTTEACLCLFYLVMGRCLFLEPILLKCVGKELRYAGFRGCLDQDNGDKPMILRLRPTELIISMVLRKYLLSFNDYKHGTKGPSL